MAFTLYLAATAVGPGEFQIELYDSSAVVIAQRAVACSRELRYSPIMPAYLVPKQDPPPAPESLSSLDFFFTSSPYRVLGSLKGDLSADERKLVYFTEGLASLVFINFAADRTNRLRRLAGNCPVERWQPVEAKLNVRDVILHAQKPADSESADFIVLPKTEDADVRVYIEQISASLASLWASYGLYFSAEKETLRRIIDHVNALLQQHLIIKSNAPHKPDALSALKDSNAIKAALVEISAALSYSVTQGTSGSMPILSNRAPFPHHSLLGIGGAVRALTKFTRYLESAFLSRSATKVISNRYSTLEHVVPGRISEYASGPEYKLIRASTAPAEDFDSGGDLPEDTQVPLITHFSLRYGFMESKFSVTAASEALTAETLPQWTLMTLSHEVMHSRVRTIFQALFGKTWNDDHDGLISKPQFDEFSKWFQTRKNPEKSKVDVGLRNLILYFCYALEKCSHPTPESEHYPRTQLNLEQLNQLYRRHKHLAIELMVHFHDYYFVYAFQPKIYIRSLWASWISVARPYDRPVEYLIRSLATVACGTALKPGPAFDYAKDVLFEGLYSLEASGVTSPLFDELRRLLSPPGESLIRARFQACYYIIDSFRRYFASRTISSKIDHIESDPFSEGSSAVDDYTANIYVFGEGQPISPIRYSVAMLYKTLTGQCPLDDAQWLTAWNYLVLSS